VEVRARGRAEPFTTKDGSTIRELLGRGTAVNQSLAEATLAPGQATQRHYHALTEEIYYLVAGSGEMEVDGERAQVGPEDAVLIPPGARHQLTAGPDGCRLLCCCAPAYAHEDTYFD
jgi:quercetin dioxygenase-like cupin family protein